MAVEVSAVARAASVASKLATAQRQRESERVFAGIQHLRQLRHFHHFSQTQLSVQDRDSGAIVPFRLNWIQRQILAELLRARRRRVRPWLIVLKYRRGGVSAFMQALAYHRLWSSPNTKALTVAHRNEDTRTIFEMVARFYDHQPAHRRHKKSQADVMRLDMIHWKAEYKADTAGATGLARGGRIDQVHLSEAAQYHSLATLHEGIVDTIPPDGIYCIESTPKGKEGRGKDFYEFWQAAKLGKSTFIPLFFAWWQDPRNRMALRYPDEMTTLDGEEQRIKALYQLDDMQLKWWRQKRRELDAKGRGSRAILEEHPNDDEECFLEVGDGYYSETFIDECLRMTRPPMETEDLEYEYPTQVMRWIEKGVLKIWEEPKEGALYAIGVDPAEGVGGDDSAIVCFNCESGEQAFTWSTNTVPPDQLGFEVLGHKEHGLGWIWKAGEMAPAYEVIERQNHGHAVLTGLIKIADYPSDSIYHDIDETADDPKESKRAGWSHNHLQLTVIVGRMIREKYPKIRDQDVVRSIQRVTSGKEGQAVFSGRDRAVAAGLGALGVEYAEKPAQYAMIGGILIDLNTGEPVKGAQPDG